MSRLFVILASLVAFNRTCGEAKVAPPPVPAATPAPVPSPAAERVPDPPPPAAAPSPSPARAEAPNPQQTAALQQLVALAMQQNEQLAQLNQHAADGAASAQAEAARAAAVENDRIAALETLRQVYLNLSAGDYDGADQQLVVASSAVSEQARLDVQAARDALAQSDLFTARQALVSAMNDAELGR